MSVPARARSIPFEGAAWLGLGIAVMTVAVVIHALIVDRSRNLVWGIAVASLLGLILWGFVTMRLRTIGASRWWFYVLAGGMLARLAMSLAHLTVGMVLLDGNVDFVGYPFWGKDVGDLFLSGRLPQAGDWYGTNFVGRLSGLIYLLVDWDLVGMFMISAWIGFLGGYLFLRAVQIAFPEADHRLFALGILFLPSFSYWTGALGKDSWMFFFLGGLTYWTARLLERLSIPAVLGVGVFLGAAALMRIHVAVVFALAIGLSWMVRPNDWRGDLRYLRPVVMVGSFVLFGMIFNSFASTTLSTFEVSRFTAEELIERAMRRSDALAEGTSTAVGAAFAPSDYSPRGMLTFLPYGIFTYLFRPLLFETMNPLLMVAAVESTFFLFVVVIRFRDFVRTIASARSRPFVLFCVVSLIGVTAILSFQSNFGLIIRQRTQVLPYLIALLTVAVPLAAPREARSNH